MFGCHVCEGIYCRDAYFNIRSKTECPLNTTTCYTTMKNGDVNRGCGSAGPCADDPMLCRICTYSFCNNEKIKENFLVCPQTRSTKYEMMDELFPITLRVCKGIVISGLEDRCLKAKTSIGRLTYGCMYSDHRICNGWENECTYADSPRELIVRFECLQCKENRTRDNTCETNLKVLQPRLCPFKAFSHVEGCFVRYTSENNYFERGCLSELEPLELVQCYHPQIHDCHACIEKGCNTGGLYFPPRLAYWQVTR